MYPRDLPVEEFIREARERFNLAIENRDIETIRSLLAPEYHIVTGRSEQSHGADREAARWAERFRSDLSVIYRRTPRDVTINEDWGWPKSWGIGGAVIPAKRCWSIPQASMLPNGSAQKAEIGSCRRSCPQPSPVQAPKAAAARRIPFIGSGPYYFMDMEARQ
jgi:hypothetical protein